MIIIVVPGSTVSGKARKMSEYSIIYFALLAGRSIGDSDFKPNHSVEKDMHGDPYVYGPYIAKGLNNKFYLKWV